MFSVVGLVGLAILIFIFTMIIRHCRVEKFDKDVARTAVEAATTAHNPDFDGDYGYSLSSHGAGGYSYTDTYHHDPVTFPPMRGVVLPMQTRTVVLVAIKLNSLKYLAI